MPRLLILLSLLLSNLSFATDVRPMPESLAPILSQVMPAVVNIAIQRAVPGEEKNEIKAKRKSPQFENIGSGVIIDANKGYIITNDHVIRHASVITVTLNDGRKLKAKLVGADSGTDIALLQIEASKLPSMKMGDSDKLHVGDFVVAIGNPFGLDSYGHSQTSTFGIISALQRTDLNIEGVENFIQTDAAINPGNSGGALINTKGEVVGINTAILAPHGGGSIGIGFAIPINMVQDVVQQLIKYGQVHRGLMGIFVQHLTPELADAFGIEASSGALVSQVNQNSPAERAGLRAGDVIMEINGNKVTKSGQVRTMVSLIRVGSSVRMSVLRNGKTIQLNTVVTDLKKHEEQLIAENPFFYGLALSDFEQESPMHGFVKGVQVVGAQENSPAWLSGIRPGDVIIDVNQQTVLNYEDLRSTLKKAKGQILVHVLRGPGAMYFVIKPMS